MNTTALTACPENRWRTYGKALMFAAPAIAAWQFACVYLAPRLGAICRDTRFEPGQAWWLWDASWILVRYGMAIGLAVAAMLLVLEWRGHGWERYRRVVIGMLVWIANVTVFFGLIALLILTMLAAPGLKHAM